MINEIQDIRAKGQAAYELLVEILTNTKVSNQTGAVRQFLDYLLAGRGKKSLEALDLNEVFEFILFGPHLLVIPKPSFGENDLLVLKNFRDRFDFEPELIEFQKGEFKADPNIFMPGYLRFCLQRGKKCDFREG